MSIDDTKQEYQEHLEEEWAELTASSEDDVAVVTIRDTHVLELDEPEYLPTGNDEAPCPADYLVAGVAGCQVEVLKQCFAKARIEDYEIRATVATSYIDPENAPEPMPDHMSIRLDTIDIDLMVETSEDYAGRVQRCLDVAEESCIISRSVESGIDVSLTKTLEVRTSEAEE